jgi:hypothetical protein
MPIYNSTSAQGAGERGNLGSNRRLIRVIINLPLAISHVDWINCLFI